MIEDTEGLMIVSMILLAVAMHGTPEEKDKLSKSISWIDKDLVFKYRDTATELQIMFSHLLEKHADGE